MLSGKVRKTKKFRAHFTARANFKIKNKLDINLKKKGLVNVMVNFRYSATMCRVPLFNCEAKYRQKVQMSQNFFIFIL